MSEFSSSPPGSVDDPLADRLRGCPALRDTLAKLCDRCDRRGELRGRIKLGNADTPPEVVRALRELFGGALKTNPRQEHHLDLTRFMETVPDPERWIRDLYATLDRERRNCSLENARIHAETERLVDRFRLAHPGLVPVLPLLKHRAQRITGSPSEETFREIRNRWDCLARTIEFLQENTRAVGISELGARFFNDSKALRRGSMRSELLRWLEAVEPPAEGEGRTPDELLARHGVTENPTSIRVTLFGALRYRVAGEWFDWPCELRRRGQSVTLSLDNLADLEAAEFRDGPDVVTCENETPFNRLIRDGIEQPVVYTAGFPNSAVRSLLQALPAETRIRHWGDSDRAGLRIAEILATIRPLTLWRCNVEELRRHRNLLKSLSPAEQQAIERRLADDPCPG
ncbi:MAG: DUF2399 domain-containing protein, partial [Verrucomicrobiota bacterium]